MPDGVQPGNEDEGGQVAWSVRAHRATVMDLAWSADAERLAVFAAHEPMLILDPQTGAAFDWRAAAASAPAFGWGSGVGAIAWSPDGGLIALADGRSAQLVDTATWERVVVLDLEEGHASDTLAFSPDGRRVAGGVRPAGGGQVGCICLVVWDVATGAVASAIDMPRNPLTGSRGYASTVAWRPDGSQVAASTRFATMVVDVGAGVPINALPPAHALAWSPDGDRIALTETREFFQDHAAGGGIAVWDAETFERLVSRRVHDGVAYGLAWLPDGSTIVSGGRDGDVVLVDAASLTDLARVTAPGPVQVVRVAPDGRTVAVGTRSGMLYVLASTLAEPVGRYPIGGGRVHTVALSPDERYVASGGDDGTVRVWSVATGAMVTEWVPGGGISALAWSSDGRWLAVAADGVTLYEMTGWRYHATPYAGWPSPPVEALSFAPDGRTLAAASYEEVTLIDVVGGNVLRRFNPYEFVGEGAYLQRLAWSPTGDMLVAASEDGSLWAFTVSEGGAVSLANRARHLDGVRSLAWHPDGGRLAVTGQDYGTDAMRTVVLDAATLEPLEEMVFLAGGTNLASGYVAGGAWFWAAGTAHTGPHPDPPPGYRNAVNVWDVASGTWVDGLADAGTVGGVAWAEDGSFGLIANWQGDLWKWMVRQP